jgi:hypothetical protein
VRCGNTFSCTLIDPVVLRSSARGLPDGGQSEVAEGYLKSMTEKWAKPTEEFVERATDTLKTFIEKVIKARCEHLSYGGLDSHLMCGHTSSSLGMVMLTIFQGSD